jgi:hypothetical protein
MIDDCIFKRDKEYGLAIYYRTEIDEKDGVNVLIVTSLIKNKHRESSKNR